MRIGVLTFHSQLNYGGVLQAWALTQALETLGHEAWVVDRWLNARNTLLWGPLKSRSPRTWYRWLSRGLSGCGDAGLLARHVRTVRFVRGRMRLTPFHFCAWEEVAGRDLGVDGLVVGSDQVWHCGDWGEPRPYLLEGAPEGLPAIAYAASFGMTAIPQGWVGTFRAGLGRFVAIGVREAEGVRLAGELGFRATHVLDPTQLVPAATWRERLGVRRRSGPPRLVCYFLSESPEAAWPALEAFARQAGARVEVLVNDTAVVKTSPGTLARRAAWRLRRVGSPVTIRYAAGPREFVEAFANAQWVLSDSFHALMFASIFGKDVRLLRPVVPARRRMFARIEEFASRYASGPLLADGVEAALRSLEAGPAVTYDEAALTEARDRSRAWLGAALDRLAPHSEAASAAPLPTRRQD